MVEEYSAYPTEKEIILPTFCKFRIKNIKSTTELKWLVELECLYVDRQMYDTGQQSIIVDQNDEKSCNSELNMMMTTMVTENKITAECKTHFFSSVGSITLRELQNNPDDLVSHLITSIPNLSIIHKMRIISALKDSKSGLEQIHNGFEKIIEKIDGLEKKMDIKIDGLEKNQEKMDIKIDGLEKNQEKMDIKIDGLEIKLEKNQEKLEEKINELFKKGN